MNKNTVGRVKAATLSLLASLGFVCATATEAQAQARWVPHASNVHVVVDGDGVVFDGVSADAWALSKDLGPGGGNKVLKGNEFCTGGCTVFQYEWFADGGAEGTSLTFQHSNLHGGETGRPWIVGKNNTVWYRTTAGWFPYPTNRCEGGTISMRQVLGQTAIAVGYGTNVYVIESNNPSGNSVRWWSGSCWYRTPAPPSAPTTIGIWPYPELHQQTNPWISTTSGAMYRWTGAAWVAVSGGISRGVGGGRAGSVIGWDRKSIWNANASGSGFTWRFDRPVNITNIGDGNWYTDADGKGFRWDSNP
jgi:hypothetical protein